MENVRRQVVDAGRAREAAKVRRDLEVAMVEVVPLSMMATIGGLVGVHVVVGCRVRGNQ